MSRTLLLVSIGGFASGILCRSLFVFPEATLLFPLLLVTICFGSWLRTSRLSYLCCAALCFTFILGAGRVALVPATLPEPFVPLVNTEVLLEGVVAGEPDLRETSQRIPLLVEKEGVRTTVLVVAPLHPEVAYGERIRAEGVLVLPEPFDTDGGRIFRYDQFLAKDGVFALMERSSVAVRAPAEGVSARIMGALLRAKQSFQHGLAAALPEPSASLASGLITGGKQGLGEDLLHAFVIAGLVHIVVLSGYNVMIVAEGVLRALGFLPRRTAAIAAGVTIALFVLAAGAGAASIRAGIMAGLALLARATGRTYAVVRALLFAAIVMLMLNPLLLAYDPGFQLSFLATLGLIVGSPIVSSWLGFVRSVFWKELLSATIAAQVAVLPLLLFQTGLFSLISLPANLLVLPLVPLAMAASGVAGVIGMITPAVAPVLGLPAYVLLTYILTVAEIASALPFAAITLPKFPFIATALAYAFLGVGVWKTTRAMKGTSASVRLY